MKRIAIFLTLVIGFGTIYAQKGKVMSAISLVDSKKISEALEKIKPALEHPKTKEWPKTYYAMGRIHQAIYESKNSEDKKLFAGDALAKALEYYQKAINLDKKGRFKNEINIMLTTMNNQFINRGVDQFGKEDYKGAMESFKHSMVVSKYPVFGGAIDTAIIFNAGLAAENAKIYDSAINLYNEAKKYGFGEGSTYLRLDACYIAKGDTTNAINILKEGFEKYPNDNNVLINLINRYLTANKSLQALEYIQLAKKSEPENVTYITAEGTIYDTMGEKEKALNSYKEGIKIDPNNFRCHFNIGVIYFNRAVEIFDKAANEMNDKKYEEMANKGKAEFRNALPYMEKAHEITPEDRDVLSTLSTLYYRLGIEDKYKEVKEKLKQ